MRTLDAALLAAQNAASAAPAMYLAVEDRTLLSERLSPVTYHPGRGTAYLGVSEGLSNSPYVAVACVDAQQRLWFYLSGLNGSPGPMGQIPLQSAQNSPTVDVVYNWPNPYDITVFYVGTTGRTIRHTSSQDGGLSWTPAATAYTEPAGRIDAMAVCLTAGGPVVVYALDQLGADPDDLVRALYHSGGVWNGPVNYLAAFNDVTALDVDADAADATKTCTIVLTVTDSRPVTWLMTSTYRHGQASLSTFHIIVETAQGSGAALNYPAVLAKRAGETQAHLITWLETIGSQVRVWAEWTPDSSKLALPIPLTLEGLSNCQHKLTHGYYTNALVSLDYEYDFFRWSALDPYKRRDDLGQYVTGFDLVQEEDKPGKLKISLDDANGRFAAAGTEGTNLQMLRIGACLNLGIGYHTPSGPLYAYNQGWVITDLCRRKVRTSKGSTAEFVIEATDPLGWLERATLPWTLFRTTATNANLLAEAINAVTLSLTYPAHDRNNRSNAKVAIHAGTPYAQLLLKLIRELGYRLTWPANQGTSAAAVATAVMYDYDSSAQPALHLGGAGETAILEARDERLEEAPNHVLVTGMDPNTRAYYYGEAWDAAAVALNNHHRSVHKPNFSLSTQPDCQDAAERHLLRFTRNRRRTEVRTRYQLQAEIGDVIRVTDSWLGLSDTLRWLRKIKGTYDAKKGLFETVLTLQGGD